MTIDEAVKAIVEKYSTSKVMILPCGNVGCGKTTLIRKLMEHKFDPELFVTDIDFIATMLHGGDYTRFNEKLFPLYGAIKSQITEEVLHRGKSIAVDGTNFSVSARFKYLSIAREYKAGVVVADFGSGSEIALNRRMAESRGYAPEKWVGIFKNMKMGYVTPNLEEGFDEIFRIEND